MSRNREIRFQLPLPLDVEPVLEGLLGQRVLAQAFRARSNAAGDFVAELIRQAAAVKTSHKDPYPPARGLGGQRRPATSMRRGVKPPEPEDD